MKRPLHRVWNIVSKKRRELTAYGLIGNSLTRTDSERAFVEAFLAELRGGTVPDPAAVELAGTMLDAYLDARPRRPGRKRDANRRWLQLIAVERARLDGLGLDAAIRKGLGGDHDAIEQVTGWYVHGRYTDEMRQARAYVLKHHQK